MGENNNNSQAKSNGNPSLNGRYKVENRNLFLY